MYGITNAQQLANGGGGGGGGGATTYYCDKSWQGGTVLFCGGKYTSGTDAGLWCWNGSFSASTSGRYVGGRLCYRPWFL